MTIAAATSAAFAVSAVATTSVNVRSGPSTGYQVVDTLYPGEQVEVSECQGGWCYVQHPGPDGWVSGNYLDIANRPQPRPQPQPSPGRPDCDFGLSVGPGGPDFSIRCGDNPPPVRAPRVCFYDGPGYTGARFCVRAGQSDSSLPGYWNDRITSVRIEGGAQATLCRNFGYGGFCRTLYGSEARLGRFLNNRVSSYYTDY